MVLVTGLLPAQSYNTAAGIRLGTDWGLTVRHRVYNNFVIEGLVQSSLLRDETNLTLLATQHQPILIRNVNLYFGGGFHKGWINEIEGESGIAIDDPFGLDLLVGIELTLGRLNFTYDVKPAINISGGERTFYTQTGVSMRYVLWKRDKYEYEYNKKRRERRKRRRERRRERDRKRN